jgi:hypothetical protein
VAGLNPLKLTLWLVSAEELILVVCVYVPLAVPYSTRYRLGALVVQLMVKPAVEGVTVGPELIALVTGGDESRSPQLPMMRKLTRARMKNLVVLE